MSGLCQRVGGCLRAAGLGAAPRRGALLDLGATGWIAAVPSIRTAAVEPSLKLVALREVAERNDDPDDVLDAMDRLL